MIPSALQPFIIDTPEAPAHRIAGVSRHRVTYLRFADRAEQQSAFIEAGIVANGEHVLPPEFHWRGIGDICVVGLLVDEPAVPGPADAHGCPTSGTPATFLPGWHVNILPAS